MKQFLETILPEYKLPSRAYINKKMELKKQQYEANLKTRLDLASDVALSADLFHNARQTYFLYLGVHFFDKTFRYISVGLCFKRFAKSDHLSEKVNLFIKNTLNKYKISAKVRSITTNNSDTILKAVNNNEFGTRLSCLIHNLNSTLNSALSLNDNVPFENECDGDFDDDMLYLTEDEDNFKDDDEAVKDSPEEKKQLSDDEDSEINEIQETRSKFDNEISPQSLNHVINKVRRLIRFILKTDNLNRFVRAEANKNEIKLNLVIDMPLRWHSTFVMLDRFVQHMKVIDSLQASSDVTNKSFDKLKPLKMTNNDWIVIKSMVVESLKKNVDILIILAIFFLRSMFCSHLTKQSH